MVNKDNKEAVQNTRNKKSAIELLSMSRRSDDSGIEVNCESTNNGRDHSIDNYDLINVDDSISVGDEDDKYGVLDLNKIENVGLKSGSYLLDESSECMNKKREKPNSVRKVRYASTDCCDYKADSFQLHCHGANLQSKTKHLSSRNERSKSLDSCRPKLDKNRSKADQNDNRHFITNKENANKKHDELENIEKQPNIYDINSCEIALRIKMADKQRK
jgi:hypothetical protein